MFFKHLCIGQKDCWTRTWWSGVDDEKVKEGKRLIFPGLHSQISCCRESARKLQRISQKYTHTHTHTQREREREKERQTDRQTWGPKL